MIVSRKPHFPRYKRRLCLQGGQRGFVTGLSGILRDALVFIYLSHSPMVVPILQESAVPIREKKRKTEATPLF